MHGERRHQKSDINLRNMVGDNQCGPLKILQALAAYQHEGFSVSGLFPVNRSDDLALIEVDCVMVNRRHLIAPT